MKHLFAALIVLLPLAGVSGCISAPTHDPAIAFEKAQRQRLSALRLNYNRAEDAIDQALVSGALPVADALRLRDELHGTVRPLIEIAGQALGSPDFEAKASAAEKALATVGQKPATTQPDQPGQPVQPVQPTGSYRA